MEGTVCLATNNSVFTALSLLYGNNEWTGDQV